MEVCIIGGGFSGIISAKVCLENGLTPVILEKSQSPGGIWRGYAGEVGVWESMHTNNSKYALTFSDFPWSPEVPDYPSWREVKDYLQGYIEKHDMQRYFSYESMVTKVKQLNGQYLVRWSERGEKKEKTFPYMIVAAGLFVQVNEPLKNSEVFKGSFFHSSSYRKPDVFTGKQVVCVGKNFSASDIACEALQTASKVTQVFKRSTLMVNKYITSLPCELLTMTYKSIVSCNNLFPSEQQLLSIKQDIIQLCGNPGEIHPLWRMDEQESGSIYAVYADDNYINAIANNRITLIQGEAKEFCENGITLNNGEHVPADIVVLATGYHRAFSFLSKKIKQIVKYNEEKPGLSMSLYRGIFHPDLPGFCFVGNVRAFIPARYELQAEIGVRFLLGNLGIGKSEMNQGVTDEDFIRNNGVAEDYDPKSYLYELLKVLKFDVDLNFVREELEFENGMFLPQFLRVKEPAQMVLCRNVIEEIKSRYPGYVCR